MTMVDPAAVIEPGAKLGDGAGRPGDTGCRAPPRDGAAYTGNRRPTACRDSQVTNASRVAETRLMLALCDAVPRRRRSARVAPGPGRVPRVPERHLGLCKRGVGGGVGVATAGPMTVANGVRSSAPGAAATAGSHDAFPSLPARPEAACDRDSGGRPGRGVDGVQADDRVPEGNLPGFPINHIKCVGLDTKSSRLYL